MTTSVILVLSASATLAFILVILVPFFYTRWSKRSLAIKCRNAKALVLTYDDGPSAGLTLEIIEILRRQQVAATFFVLGRSAELNPDVLDKLLSEGHEVGCHGYQHSNAWRVWPHIATDDIMRGYMSMVRWLPPTAMFRPPYGKITLFTWIAILRRKAHVVWWTHDSQDTCTGALPSVESIVNDIINDGGGVVLLHDFDRDLPNNQCQRNKFVLRLTETLIKRARQAGINVLKLGDVI